MLLQSATLPGGGYHTLASSYYRTSQKILISSSPILPPLQKAKASSPFVCLRVGTVDIAQIAHNKVLIAAAVSAAVAQFSKPFSSAFLYGNNIDFKAAVQAGGFPSSHSSTVVAAATTLALERGFSDSIVGLTIVYAGLVMYDAQGVRREVGNHARLLNKMHCRSQVNSIPSKDADDLINSQQERSSFVLGSHGPKLSNEDSCCAPKSSKAPVLIQPDQSMRESIPMQRPSSIAADVEEGLEEAAGSSSISLKESIGHTQFEVVAGALLGFFVSLVVCAIM
ncbi:uncharacterized protein LOC131144426 [Malania oleifera]|uniref:uncharacterized protein LOC131144426 n=1 Tax=Malania oleifera TaxID=397392 RepID=UPI0025AE977F|nr:uncharacterized protein LOC131144426 [Malania oleifera]